jgi:hypothetical protein
LNFVQNKKVDGVFQKSLQQPILHLQNNQTSPFNPNLVNQLMLNTYGQKQDQYTNRDQINI